MKRNRKFACVVASLLLSSAGSASAKGAAPAPPSPATPVTVENFVRAETDLYMRNVAKEDGFGKFHHLRELTPIDRQAIVRMNRDTLYSTAVFDLNAGPVTIVLPKVTDRFFSMQIIDEDHYVSSVVYSPGAYTYSREQVGTRYVLAAVRILVNPSDRKDMEKAHDVQDAIKIEQKEHGKLELPTWDADSQKKVRDALLVLGATLPDTKGMFGRKIQVDPLRHLIGTAVGWGGNPERDATYLTVTPKSNDGKKVFRLSVKDVPVDGFWSVSVYNAKGYFEKNAQDAYTLSDVTAKKASDGSVTVQFGGCGADVANCLPITPGWNYTVRLYRPRAEILDGRWTFPEAEPVPWAKPEPLR